MVDRFHDNNNRKPVPSEGKTLGFGTEDQLQTSCGGTLQGITNHLDYIKDLGCTALWLSPIYENNEESYHGYAVQDYTEVDKRFGSKEDLAALVDAAHARDMRVFLDVVLHHTGNNWSYPNEYAYYYYNGAVFPFGKWRYEDKPVPTDVAKP